MSGFDRRLVEGPILPAMWSLAWPMVIQNVVQVLQGFIDHVMVGRFVGFEGNAAIGIGLHIYMGVVVFAVSLHWGMAILVSRFAGADEPDKVARVLWSAIATSFFLGLLVLAPVGYFLTPALLDLVRAEPTVQAEAVGYLRILFLGSFGMLTNNMLASALRAAGDTRTPLHLGVLLTLFNIVLNIVLIRGLGPIPALGTRGAALGTVLAQGVVLVITASLLARGRLILRLPPSLRVELSTVTALFRFGLPASLQGIAVNLGYLFLVRFIGSLEESAEAQAAYAVAYTQLFMFLYMVVVALMTATQTMVGQNLGAGNLDRAIRTPRSALVLGLLIAGPASSLFLFAPRRLLGFFGLEDPTVLALGSELLAYMSLGGLLVVGALIYTGALQGAGDTKSPAYIVLFSQIVLPLGLCAVLDASRGLTASDIWLALLLGHLARFLLAAGRFHQEKWHDIRVDIG